MKKLVHGKIYNTETATKIGGTGSEAGVGDFRWEHSALYRTQRGNWFVAGEGGPMTRFARKDGDGSSYGSGSGVIPLTPEEALIEIELAQPFDTDVVEQYLSDLVEAA